MDGKMIDYYNLSKDIKNGTAILVLIKKILNDPDIFVFGEFLELELVKNFQNSSNQDEIKTYQLLELFAYGNWKDYINNKEKYGELTNVQQKKLKQLTIVSLGSKNKQIPYNLLVQDLEIKSVRELEDLVLDTFYQELVAGKLDQINSLIHIDKVKARDIRLNDLNLMNDKLLIWIQKSEELEKKISDSISLSQKKFKEFATEKVLFEEELQKKIIEVNKLLEEKGGENDHQNPGGRRHRKRNPSDLIGGRSFMKRFRN
eukprot:TRINITY_DN10732_c0_g1_i1.p1 TRINITY_DN10732_c0_g1~~TRINITY_DN10732_c0_g1_i1.p1  ORF type:complete len:259 (+),score=82.45 TRINITY_DN10732_c0_g1_i1:52-828(+)